MNKNSLKRALMIMTVAGAVASCGEQTSQEKATLDVSQIDTTVNPTEDFYQFANKGWMEENPLPGDESRFGSFDLLRKETNKKVNELVTELAKGTYEHGTYEQKISDFYTQGMDTVKINKMGIEPLKGEFAMIDAIEDIEGVNKQISHFHLNGIGTLFGFYGSADAKNSEMNIAQIGQGGLGMNRDYYVEDNERSQVLRDEYVKHMTAMFELSGVAADEAKMKAERIMELETRLAKASMTLLERRDPHKTYNKTDLAGVKEMTPNFNWNGYFDVMGLGDPGDINVGQPKFFAEVNTMLDQVPVDTWKDYFRWNLLNSTANYLSDGFVEQHFHFYGKIMTGSEEMKPRWRRVLATTNGALGEVIGKKFVEKHFPPEAKERMVSLVENLREALGQRINNLEWMSGETKERAQEKLATMNVKIGYPDKWEDFSNLEVQDDAYVLNVLRSRKFSRQKNLEEIGKPVNKDEWFFPPQTVNAYYAPSLNEICFPAGILQPPFFYIDGDDAINYGAIGAVIGHEMTHGFDDKGRLYDKEGNLNEWWTAEDAEKFNTRAEVLVDQFNQITIIDELKADGKLSLGENIADLGGLSIAYTAFQNASENKEQPTVEGYTPEQRFFLSWARVWAQNIRDKEMIRLTKEDVHSLGVNRVNGPLKNMQAFYNAFGVEPGDQMYLPAESRALIW